MLSFVRRAALAVVFSLSAGTAIGAQGSPQHLTGGNEGKTPLGWRTRLDGAAGSHKASDTVAFAQMTPGFHVTTGPGAILYHPDSSARGDFTVESQIFLFPTKGRDREGYGVIVGGRDLDGAAQAYTYFLLRNDGKFLVKQRAGERTTTLVDWTASQAIKVQVGDKAMANTLAVTAAGNDVAFLVNGSEVAKLPRAQVAPEGIYGVRFNHAVNAHVTKVSRR